MKMRKIGYVIDVLITTGCIAGSALALCFFGAVTAMLWGREQIEGALFVLLLLALYGVAMHHLSALARVKPHGQSFVPDHKRPTQQKPVQGVIGSSDEAKP